VDPEEHEPIGQPIDGTLDLHTFDPSEVEDLLRDYLEACGERGILEVRIVHGKGQGILRARVEAILDRLPEVLSRRTAGADAGGWGATLVTLRPPAR
jgi:DNA-nicking Smr family endonuclease